MTVKLYGNTGINGVTQINISPKARSDLKEIGLIDSH
jgi:hypothetical protein